MHSCSGALPPCPAVHLRLLCYSSACQQRQQLLCLATVQPYAPHLASRAGMP
jgi:hypothetical protein